MTTPAYLIAIIISTLYGAVFHLYKGGNASRLLLYLVSSWMGFIIGHNISPAVGASIYSIGPLNVGMASLGSGLAIVLAHWLAKRKNVSW
jgi:hypothetical protein|tara:strand:+ start:291 stop:560 length:270 start_codon:yes stop_codon:yes gene_type:complete